MPKPVAISLPDSQVVPEPMLEKRTRRQFSTEYVDLHPELTHFG